MVDEEKKAFHVSDLTLDIYRETGRVMDRYLITHYPDWKTVDRWGMDYKH
jgi:hypothetical protein